MHFSQDYVSPRKIGVFPPFLRNGWTDRAEIFFASTWNESGWVFFFSLKNNVRMRFGRLQNTHSLEKRQVFWGVFSILPLLTRRNGIFQRKKKHAPRFVPSTCKKNFSSIGSAVSEKTGENFWSFWLLGAPKPPEGGIWQFWVYDKFCSTHRHLSALRVSQIFAEPFFRKVGKGALPLMLWNTYEF